jgi:hypothetical protein
MIDDDCDDSHRKSQRKVVFALLSLKAGHLVTNSVSREALLRAPAGDLALGARDKWERPHARLATQGEAPLWRVDERLQVDGGRVRAERE